ncbi:MULTISPECIES: hypothetical protein [Streptosporangium]|uniref:Uncharacterized protein n=1 Tax=Streptosporangium brasiliense TaxID=47480 RepID=A0ABT9RC17_9ACTN|nr:hypothetical protein [Streptosporangium brasiliense]MDP9866802.1 hypothetical protein [Streptosporangium brasiliense]
MPETIERGRQAGESRTARTVRYAVELLFFAATLGIVYTLWG